MIDLTCGTCGCTMRQAVGAVYKDDLTIEVTCDDCSEKLTTLITENADMEGTIEHNYEIFEEYDRDIENLEKQIKDLKDFIDGYIDDKPEVK